MIEIKNEKGRILEHDPTFMLTFERNNPLFNSDSELVGDVTYPGTAPLTSSNKHFISSGHLIEKSNKAYEFPVMVSDGYSEALSGLFNYSIKKGNIEFIVKINLGTIYERLENTMITDIQNPLENIYPDKSPSEFLELMIDTQTFPHLYPFVFCPIYNNKKSTDELKNKRPYLNAWLESKEPYIYAGVGWDITHEAPFYRLGYVLKQVSAFFGYRMSGSFFTDPYYDDIYVYTNRTVEYLRGRIDNPPPVVRRTIGHFGKYMPNISVAEFLRVLRNRLHMNISIDTNARMISIDIAKNMIEGSHVLDLSNYISEISEISVERAPGLTVTLKPDPSDEAFQFKNPLTDRTESFPEFELVVNDGEETLELEVSTLTKASSEVSSSMLQSIGGVMDPVLEWGDGFPDGFPIARTNKVNNWPLRLFRYTGKTVATGFPRSVALNLDERDIQWYRFISETKKVILIAFVPPLVLSAIELSKKIQFISEQNYVATGVISKMEYSLGHERSSLIEVELTVNMINTENDTTASINPVDPTEG